MAPASRFGQLSDAAIVAVLAGGRGERIGGAKPTRKLAGSPLICYPLRAAREAGLEAVVVAKRETVLPPVREHVVVEPDEPRHPLCGALAALDYASRRGRPGAGVVLVGCDMPFLSGALLRRLAELDGAALLSLGGRRQPLPARLTPRDAGALRLALDARCSLSAAFDSLSPHVLDERRAAASGDARWLCFSVNGPDDLREAERRLADEPRDAPG
jgi:molybdenum cofactor guanylyltransferase